MTDADDTTNGDDTIEVRRADEGFDAADFDHRAWERAVAVQLTRYWSGDDAPPARHAEARLLWTPESLCVRFEHIIGEPLVVSDAPRTEAKTLGLWDRDVCELFVAPDANEPDRYYEFEVAPTGEWVDLRIDRRPEGRATDWQYASGMRAAARVEGSSVVLACAIPWAAFDRPPPSAGDVWRANLFRCVGTNSHADGRGYLAWRPTRTAQPSFHVPAAFGRLVFTDRLAAR